MRLVSAVLLLLFVEIALLITAGSLVGLWPVLLVVTLSTLFGLSLVRSGGLGAVDSLRRALSGDDPGRRPGTGARPLLPGVMRILAGVLLLPPGLLTSAAGLVLLLPRVQVWLARRLQDRVTVRGYRAATMEGEIIEGEFVSLDRERLVSRRH